MTTRPQNPFLTYANAALAVALATAVRLLLDPWLRDRVPFITYFPAVVFAAWYGGLRPAVLATVLSAVTAGVYFIPPPGPVIPADGWLALGVFVFVCAALALMSESLRSARRRAEAATAEMALERERFAVTLSSIGDGVVVTDTGGVVTFLNPAAEKLTAWPAAEAVGRPLAEVFPIVHEQTREPVENPTDRALREGVIVGMANHTVLLARDGAERPIDDSAAPVRGADGRVRGAVLVFRDVAERRRAVRALRESEHRFRTMANSAPVMIWVSDADAKCTFLNRPWVEFTGRPPEQQLGDGWLEVIHPDDQPRVLGTYQSAFRDRREFRMEYRLRRHDGEYRWVLDDGAPLYEADGGFAGFIGSCVDVTRQKEAQQALEQSEARLAAELRAMNLLHRLSTDLMAAPDLGAALDRILDAAIEMVGADLGNVQLWDPESQTLRIAAQRGFGRDFLEHFRAVGGGGAACARAVRAGARVVIEDVEADPEYAPHRGVAAAAGYRAVQSTPLTSRTGELLGVLSTHFALPHRPGERDLRTLDLFARQAADAIERIRAGESLRQSEEQFRLLADSIPQLAWMARPDGWVFWYNRRWYDYTGATPAETEGWGWERVHDPAELPRVLEKFKAAIAAGEPWEDTFPLRRRDGEFRWHLSRALPLRDGQGRVVRWFGTNTDITERMEMEAALRDADRRKDEFLAVLAHELRNPLAPVRSGLDLLALAPDGHAETVAQMQRHVDHLVRLVDDLLDVSRIMRGRIELRREPVELAPLLRQAAQAAEGHAREHGLRLDVAVPGEPIWVDADPVRLVQVVENLLHNSCKYTDRGGDVELTAGAAGGWATVRVRDTGVGIEPELLPRVFDLFTQSSRALPRAQGGLGIGLTLVRNLVELHGGTVAASSAGPGLGSEFTVRLPTTPPPAAPAPAADAPPALEGVQFLLVDDNVGAAQMLAKLLAALGAAVRVAHDGRAALAELRRGRFDVTLLDIGLPGMDGYDVARAIRGDPELDHGLLVALTGYGQPEDRRKALGAGFDEHLVKPPTLGQIHGLLSHPKLAAGRRAPAARPPAAAQPAAGPVATAAPTPGAMSPRAGEFLGGLTHEIGNAVYLLQLMAKVLETRPGDPQAAADFPKMLGNLLPSLVKLVADLRRAGRVARGRVAPKPQPTDAAAAVRRAAEAARPLAQARGHRLDVRAPDGGLPAVADPDLLTEAVAALLDNALRYTAPGGEITVTAGRDGGALFVRVEDTGPGLPADLLPEVFDLFRRGEDAFDFAGGHFGVGLALVRQIAERHGGTVEARNRPGGRGSEFVLRLPAGE